MDRHYVPPVSIEKLASFLDGNLPEEEMRELASLISGDALLSDIVSDADLINELTEEASDIVLPEEIGAAFSLPDVPDDDVSLDDMIVSGEELISDDGDASSTIDSSIVSGDAVGLDGDSTENKEGGQDSEIVGYEEITPEEKPLSVSAPSNLDPPLADSLGVCDMSPEPGLPLDDFTPDM